MARPVRKTRVKQIPISEFRDDLSHFLHASEKEDIVITRRGRPAGVLIGFASEDDWFDYQLENDPRFLSRIAQARESFRAGRTMTLEELDKEFGEGWRKSDRK
jgi:prevent-host-death family protein